MATYAANQVSNLLFTLCARQRLHTENISNDILTKRGTRQALIAMMVRHLLNNNVCVMAVSNTIYGASVIKTITMTVSYQTVITVRGTQFFAVFISLLPLFLCSRCNVYSLQIMIWTNITMAKGPSMCVRMEAYRFIHSGENKEKWEKLEKLQNCAS